MIGLFVPVAVDGTGHPLPLFGLVRRRLTGDEAHRNHHGELTRPADGAKRQ
jgi:hypothetical protein